MKISHFGQYLKNFGQKSVQSGRGCKNIPFWPIFEIFGQKIQVSQVRCIKKISFCNLIFLNNSFLHVLYIKDMSTDQLTIFSSSYDRLNDHIGNFYINQMRYPNILYTYFIYYQLYYQIKKDLFIYFFWCSICLFLLFILLFLFNYQCILELFIFIILFLRLFGQFLHLFLVFFLKFLMNFLDKNLFV